MMHVQRFTDVARFYDLVEPLLMQHEAENNFELGLIASLRNEPANPEHVLATVQENETILAASVRTPPWPLTTTRAPDDAMDALAEWAHQNLPGLCEFAGPLVAATRCASTFARFVGKTLNIRSMMRIFQIDRVIPPRPAPGAMRVATEADLDLIVAWMNAFHIEIEEIHEIPRERIAQRVALGQFHLWQDPHPVSVAGWTGRTPNGVRINAVYTPPEFRSRGYASNLAAALTQKMLSTDRKFCFLYTDASNPTSNRIYQQIGYEFVSDWVNLELKD
jgi:predicted GNAT family acetyltransferase